MKHSDRKLKNHALKLDIIALTIILLLIFPFCSFGQDSASYVKKAWSVLGKREFETVHQITDECINKFSVAADLIANPLSDFPAQGEESKFSLMNDVATCYFIKGEALMREGKIDEAKKTFKTVINKYPYAQSFDPRGWYWSLKEKSEVTLKKLETGKIEDDNADLSNVVVTKVQLYDQGEEFPINYSKYGSFIKIGTKDYKYIVDDPIGLAKAAGEGIYPNSTSIKFDPEYVKLKKTLYKIDHWEVFNSRDLNTAFYKWNVT